MIANPPAYRPDPSRPVICAWPEDAAYISEQFAGFVMPRVDTRQAVTIPDFAARRATAWRDRVAVAENLARAVVCTARPRRRHRRLPQVEPADLE